MKEKFAGPANKTPESDSGVFPVNNLYVEPLDWGDFGDINGNKKYQRASPAEQKPRNPFLERKDYADQVVKELEKEISPTERIDALAQKKRQLGEQVTLSKQSYTQFLSETNKQLDSLEKVVGLLTANDSSKSVALLDDAKMAITELQRELNERQKEQEILLANRAEEIAAIDTEIQAFGVDPEKLSTKTLLAIEKENNEELKMLRRNLSLIAAFEPNYESIIEPLIRTIETTLGANVYFRFFDEDWFKLGFDPSGKLNQASINETLKRFHVLCRTVDRDLVTPYTEDLLSFDGVDLSNFSLYYWIK